MQKRLKNIFHAISTPPRRFWEALTTPHASVTEVGARRQAQFLAVLSFLILVLVVLQILAAAGRDMALASILFILLLLVAVAYALSRSPWPHIGSILLMYGFIGFAFVLSLRENSNIAVIMYGMIPLAFLVSSVLLTWFWQILLVGAILGGFLALWPIFAKDGMLLGNLLAMGVVFIVTSMLRNGIERRRLQALKQEITERLNIEKELRNSEERFVKIFHSSPDLCVISHQSDGKILDANAIFTQTTGYLRDECIGKTVFELNLYVNPGDRAEMVSRLREQGDVYNFEAQLRRKDGSIFIANASISPIALDEQPCLIWMARDVTILKQAEDGLRKSEALYRQAIEVANAVPYHQTYHENKPIASYDFIGEGIRQITGYGPEEFDEPLWDSITEERVLLGDLAAYPFDDAIERVRSGVNPVWKCNHRIRARDGSTHWVFEAAVELRDQDGISHGSIGTFQDITERKRAEEKIRQTSDQLSMTNEIGRAVTELRDLENVLEIILQQVVQVIPLDTLFITLYDPETQGISFPLFYEGGKRWHEPNSKLEPGSNMSRVIQTGKSILRLVTAEELEQSQEHPQVLLGDCSQVSASFMYVPLLIKGKVIGLISVQSYALNVYTETNLRLLEGVALQAAIAIENARLFDEIKTFNAELEQRVSERTAQFAAANKELEAFSYSVSHDLRAPLRAINGFSKILNDDFSAELSPMAQGFLRKIASAGDRMGHLIDDLLDFSRLSRKPLDKQSVDMTALAHTVIETLAVETANRSIEWLVAEMPSTTADPILLQQVYANLIGNAVKYSRKREAARIEIGSFYQNDGTVYFVRDNGAGFDMQYADKLFGVFQRLHRDEEFEGIGIGLATVQRIIQRHGGKIWAEAEPDKGATFYFTLA